MCKCIYNIEYNKAYSICKKKRNINNEICGATNSSIRWPFVVEGIIIGLISGAISLGIITFAYVLIEQNEAFVEFLAKLGLSLLEFSDMFNLIVIIYLLLGVGIGVLGSTFSMRKYLRV